MSAKVEKDEPFRHPAGERRHPPISIEAESEELARRLDDLESGRVGGVSWEEVRSRMIGDS